MYSIPVRCPTCDTPLVPAIDVVGADAACAGEMMCPACRNSVWIDEATMRDLVEALDDTDTVEYLPEKS